MICCFQLFPSLFLEVLNSFIANIPNNTAKSLSAVDIYWCPHFYTLGFLVGLGHSSLFTDLFSSDTIHLIQTLKFIFFSEFLCLSIPYSSSVFLISGKQNNMRETDKQKKWKGVLQDRDRENVRLYYNFGHHFIVFISHQNACNQNMIFAGQNRQKSPIHVISADLRNSDREFYNVVNFYQKL